MALIAQTSKPWAATVVKRAGSDFMPIIGPSNRQSKKSVKEKGESKTRRSIRRESTFAMRELPER
jgi:hypothetical protein